MKIFALTDLHGRTGIIKSFEIILSTVDLVVLCGDITHFGHKTEMTSIIHALRNINPNIMAVSGNCDHQDAGRQIADEGISLSGVIKEFNGISFFGLSGSLPCPGHTPNEYAEEEFEALLSTVNLPVDKPSVMVTHQPPYGTLNDRVPSGIHVGSKVIRRYIEMHQPLICFTGHIHEGQGIDTIGTTSVVNPGPAFEGGYAMAEINEKAVKTLAIHNIKDIPE